MHSVLLKCEVQEERQPGRLIEECTTVAAMIYRLFFTETLLSAATTYSFDIDQEMYGRNVTE